MDKKLLQNLNKKQVEAVTKTKGPVLIVAGAGTGKTTVITRKIVYLLDKKTVKVNQVLALTFTNKAADEMEERVEKELPMGFYDLWISTFHGFAQRILKEDGLELGLPADFKLFTATDSYLLLRENLDKLKLDYYSPRGNPTKFLQSLISHFSRLKDENITPEEYLKFAENNEKKGDDKLSSTSEKTRVLELAEAYHIYQKLLLDSKALDFGDLILYCLELFEKRPNILRKYQKQFKYILVDEFQDTNWAQYQLVKLLAKPENNLTVVGDDNQSIYRFRGAAMSNILNFRDDFKQAETVVLTDNYRSGQGILDTTYEFIQNNNPRTLEAKLGISKKLVSQTKVQADIKVKACSDQAEEVQAVVGRIKKILEVDKTATLDDFAILSRTNLGLERFTLGLAEENLAFVWLASTGLYQKQVVMDTLSYLRLLDSYHESSALWRILNLPCFGISNATLQRLTYWAKRKAWSLFATLKKAGALGVFPEEVESINKFLGLVDKHTQLARDNKLTEVFLAFWRDTGHLKHIESQGESKALEDFRYLNQFFKKVKEFVVADDIPGKRTLADFLFRIDNEQAAGDSGQLEIDPEAGPQAVKLMTVHKAKGLEFKYVFLVNLVNQVFPSRNRKDAIETPLKLTKEIAVGADNLEEERRLFYVACTRAKQGLYLSWARDQGGLRPRKASGFIAESGLEAGEIALPVLAQANLNRSQAQPQQVSEEITLPRNYSFTQFKLYGKCPLQYKYSEIYKIPTAGGFAMSFGITMHSVLQKVMQRFVVGESQTSLFDKSGQAKPSLNWLELKDIYENAWVDDWYESQEQMKKHKKLGLKYLKKWLALHDKKWPEVMFLEKGFKLDVDGVPLVGRVDRIDKVKGGVEIVDYKTGQSAKRLSTEDKEQLLLYQMVAKEAWGLKPVNLSYYYLTTNEAVSFIGQDKDLEKLKQKFFDFSQKVQSREFKPTPGRFICDYCNYKNICDYRAV